MTRPNVVPPDLGGFTFQRVIGSGGFSDVFLYEQHLPRRPVAVKVLRVDGMSHDVGGAFISEANATARLSAHPYIVPIHHASISDDGHPYLIMQYYGGPSLAEQYKRAPLSVADALRVGIRLASAVAASHAAGILHRDIKPGNVLTNEYGLPGLTDFGLSSWAPGELSSHRAVPLSAKTTSAGSDPVGLSVPWSPPEMFDEDARPDVQSDIYSLAATIFTVLKGRSPFEVPGASNELIDLVARIERGAISPMMRTDIPSTLLAALQTGMSVDKTRRWETAIDFARALQRVEVELGYSVTSIELPHSVLPDHAAAKDDLALVYESALADEKVQRRATVIDAQPVGRSDDLAD